MLRSTLLVSLSGLAAAASNYNFNSHQAHQKGLLIPGTGSQALTFSLTGTCTGSQKSCGDACIESGGECCSPSLGTYCESGTYCTASGCCPDGEICSGAPSGCAKGKELCGSYCMPEGKVCCGTGYCNEGQTCSLGECTTGSGSSGGSSGGSGGGSSGGSSGANCYSFQEECDDGCMPKGSVCCGGGKYCFSGETCLSDGTCRYGSSGGGSSGGSSGGSDDDDDNDDDNSGSGSGGSSSDDDDDATITRPSLTEPTFSSPSFTEPSIEPAPTIGEEPTFSSRPLPTGPVSGGPDDDDDDGDSSSSSSNSNGGSTNAGAINVPNFFAGLVALVPLLL
ncbi:hypothetical protein CEP54_006401 [Fusarium duplospermum]|uniref:GPI anchored protein n=1 Tax=Fusarium duplospermum TaxID=1325734 RepID=A0A428Q7D0_9HYPO|nr:hypothetical protein CEP54_006401 [Fusarium duplospermum]